MKAQAKVGRRIGVALVALCATLSTGACAAGQLAATSLEQPVARGTSGQLGKIGLHAVAIVAPDGPCILPGADAALTLVVSNDGRDADSLTSVSSPRFESSVVVPSADDLAGYAATDAGTGTCSPPSGSAAPTPTPAPGTSPAAAPLPSLTGAQTVAPNQALPLGVYSAGTNGPGVPTEPIVLLRHLQDGPLHPGEAVQVTFSFADAGTITLRVPVLLTEAPNLSFVPTVVDTGTEPVNAPS